MSRRILSSLLKKYVVVSSTLLKLDFSPSCRLSKFCSVIPKWRETIAPRYDQHHTIFGEVPLVRERACGLQQSRNFTPITSNKWLYIPAEMDCSRQYRFMSYIKELSNFQWLTQRLPIHDYIPAKINPNNIHFLFWWREKNLGGTEEIVCVSRMFSFRIREGLSRIPWNYISAILPIENLAPKK